MRKAVGWLVVLCTATGSCAWLSYVGSSAGPAFGANWPEWLPTLRLLLIGVLSLVSTFLALRGRSRIVLLFHATVALLGIWFAYLSVAGHPEPREPYSDLPVPSSLVPAICFLIFPCVFWYFVGRAGWPELLSKPISVAAKIGLLLCTLTVTLLGAVAIDFMTIWNGECHFSEPPFTTPTLPQQAVFTARILRSRKLWGPDESPPTPAWRRYWLLASVQKEFWGLPRWDHKLVILLMTARGSGSPPPRGEIDFVDGRRLPGSLTRFLTIFETFCTRTESMADSEVDLRVLRDGPPHDNVRILGRTLHLTGAPQYPRWETVPHRRVNLKGPAGLVTAESDDHGIFDFGGLPPGYYEVSRPPADGTPPSWRDIQCRWSLAGGDIRDCGVAVH